MRLKRSKATLLQMIQLLTYGLLLIFVVDKLYGEERADDGSWVYILDKEAYESKYFEKEYKVFLEVLSFGGASKAAVELKSESKGFKKEILGRIINNKLTYKEALKGSFFQGEEGKDLIKSFFKMGLNQYHMQKHLMDKIKVPKDKKVLKEYYKKHMRGSKTLPAVGDADKVDLRELKRFYTTNRLQEELTKELVLERLSSSILVNQSVLKSYLTRKLSKREVIEGGNKYWLLKIDKQIVSLKETLGIIDFHIKSLGSYGSLGGGLDVEKQTNYLLSTIKVMELSYRYCLREGYYKEEGAKEFINWVQVRSISLYHLMKNVIGGVKIPKGAGNKVERRRDYMSKVEAAQDKYLEELKSRHKVKISEKYFETQADRIEAEILKGIN